MGRAAAEEWASTAEACPAGGRQLLAWLLRAREAVARVGAHLRWRSLPARLHALVHSVVVEAACESEHSGQQPAACQQLHGW